MRRTDEAFKNELFRRYEQYKKNRRNLRFLAATPVLASVMLVCALIFLPHLKLWQASGDPIGEQPGEQPDITEQPGNQGAPLEVEPDHPFYDLLGQLEYTDVNSISLTSSFTRLAVELEDAMIDPFMTRLTNTLLTVPYDELAEYAFDGESYTISIEGDPLPMVPDADVPAVIISHNFTLSVGGEFICCDGGRWYRTDPDSAKMLVNTLNSLYAGTPAPTLPSITEDEMQALVDAGGSFHDLVALIGEPHTSVTSGLYTPAWYLADGRMLIVRIEINELSTPIPIDGYTFWESPMQDILETLERSTIVNITVTEGVQDNAVFYRSYTDQTNIEAIRELIYACTRLSVMGDPTEVDPATINPVQGSSRVIQLNCTPAPGYYGDLYLLYTIELLDASNGLFFGFSDYNTGGVATRWFKISPDPFNALWEYFESHGEDRDDGNENNITLESDHPLYPIYVSLGLNEYDCATITTGDNRANDRIFHAKSDIKRISSLLQQMLTNATILDKAPNAPAEHYTVTLYGYTNLTDPIEEPNETIYYFSEFEIVDGKYLKYLTYPTYNESGWTEVVPALVAELLKLTSSFTPIKLPMLDKGNPLFAHWEAIRQQPIRDVSLYSPNVAQTNRILLTDSTDIQIIADQLYRMIATAKATDQSRVPSTEASVQIWINEIPYEEFGIELVDGKYIRYVDGSSVDSDWYEIDENEARALIDYVTNATEPGTDGTVKENPFNSLIDLLNRNEIKTIAVTGPKGTTYYTGNDAARILVCLQNAMQVVYRETSIVDVSDGVTYTIQLTPSEKSEKFNYRTIELFGGNCLRAPDHGITQWYLIDEGLAQALIDSFETGGPLDGWTLDSYALTSLSARCVQTGEELAVTDGETLRKIGDLLLSINGTALSPDYQTLEWLSAIDADPSSVADNAAPLYIVTLRTSKDYSFYLFGDFLFANGRWWAIDHASTLESLIGGRSYTPPEDTLIKLVLEETEITSVAVMGKREDVLGGAGFELAEGELGYIGALKDQLSCLTLTECEPKSGGICDLMIVIAHGGVTVIEHETELIDDKIAITLYDGRYLHFEVTSDEWHWYEIPKSEADELIGLLGKIKADPE